MVVPAGKVPGSSRSSRSMMKNSSLSELSVHARSIWLLENAVAVRLLGAAGPPVGDPVLSS
jgi:hypothetical protein